MIKKIKYLVVACLLGSSFQGVHANVGQDYGFGSRSSALAGAGVAWGSDGFASYYNPAALALRGKEDFELTYSFVFMHPEFKSISNVVTANTFTADGETIGSVDTSYRDTVGQAVGSRVRISEDLWNLSLGATAFLPTLQIAYMDTGETYVPEYVLYRARTQRPQVDLGLGVTPFRHFYMGAGVHVAFSVTGSAFVYLQTTSTKPSTMRFTASLKPKVAPYFGIYYRSHETQGGPEKAAEKTKMEPTEEPSGSFTAGAVVRAAANSTTTMKLQSAAAVFGSLGNIDFIFNSASSLYYDPMTVELGGSVKVSRVRLLGQLEFQNWKSYVPPPLIIEGSNTEKCTSCSPTITVSSGQVPPINFRNIFVPRVGTEISLTSRFLLRAGYSFRPSIIDGLPTGTGNFLDPPKHVVTLGAGYQFQNFVAVNRPVNLDFHLAFQQLVSQDVVKTAGDELGDTSKQKIGAPGYTAGGFVVGGGLSLTMAF